MQALGVTTGVVLILLGVIQIAFPHFVWQVDKTFNEMNGVQPNRSDTWEIGRVVRAIVTILSGILVIWVSLNVIR